MLEEYKLHFPSYHYNDLHACVKDCYHQNHPDAQVTQLMVATSLADTRRDGQAPQVCCNVMKNLHEYGL